MFTALVLSMPVHRWLGERDSVFSVRVENIPNLRWKEAGFSGVNPPNQGITATVWWVQQL